MSEVSDPARLSPRKWYLLSVGPARRRPGHGEGRSPRCWGRGRAAGRRPRLPV